MTAHDCVEWNPACYRCELNLDELPKSSAASAQYPRQCPTCKALPYQACRTLHTDRVTDTHTARIRAPQA